MKNLVTTTNARRAAATLAVAVGLGLSIGAPASADQPVTYVDTWEFDDENACTGAEITLTGTTEFREHIGHANNFVGHASRTGTSSDGYVMDHSVSNFQVNGNILREAFTDTWRHPDGSAMMAQGLRVIDIQTGVATVMQFEFRCLKPSR